MADEKQKKAPGKVVWMACRAEQRDGTKGCGSSSATLVTLTPGQQPGADMATDPKRRPDVQKAFEGMLKGRVIRYKCV